ncbi:hypothetical protein Tsubulata_014892 [Turnera subulata]|uniref:Uncharacterized protein n=1 Tax=Turnera subulata TaxID=218843 RepID=A0A9Q0G337_9ROSI|nr:hypothetical protein Tsubulata_014892 [Turnera subulata]
MQREEELDEVTKMEECCLENKQLTPDSTPTASEGSGSAIIKSPGASSPATASPTHRRTSGPIRRAKGGWTQEEDETLRKAVATFKGKSWKKIAEFFPDRSEVQCLHRWQKVLNPDLIKGPWTQEEDDKIIALVARYGPTKWSVIAKSLPGRIGKQCRERTDNSIKNHWNSSLKKKLDFYLATGKLPPIPKIGTPNGTKEMNSPMIKINKESDSTAQTSSETTDSCRLEEDGKDHLELSALRRDMAASSSALPNESADSEGVDCRSQSLSVDRSCCNAESLQKSENFQIGYGTGEGKSIGPHLRLETPTYSSLYYEPPQLETRVQLGSGLSTCPHKVNISSPASSPVTFFTPPCVKSCQLSTQSPEAILRMAAKSFPNTPSIFRKRKRVGQEPQLPNKVGKLDQESLKYGIHSSGELGRAENISEKADENLLQSPASLDRNTVGPSNKAFNASPPYRLKSKRTAVFKSVERQLEFSHERDKCNGTKTAGLSVNGRASDSEGSHITKMGVT